MLFTAASQRPTKCGALGGLKCQVHLLRVEIFVYSAGAVCRDFMGLCISVQVLALELLLIQCFQMAPKVWSSKLPLHVFCLCRSNSPQRKTIRDLEISGFYCIHDYRGLLKGKMGPKSR